MTTGGGATRRRAVPALLLLALLACAASGAATLVEGPTMGTAYRVTIAGADGVDAAAVRATVIEPVLAAVNGAMSGWSEVSEVSRFNRAAGTGWSRVSERFLAVTEVARRIGERTDGAFDITVAPLVALWGFGPGAAGPRHPSDEAIAAALRRVGRDRYRLRREPPAIAKTVAGVTLDFSGIAKGFAVDEVSRALAAAGYPRHLVDIGGELRAQGAGPGGRAWRVAVERPRDGERRVAVVVALEDEAIATSGDYRRYFEAGGRRFSHTIDPRTGRPVDHRLASVSVIHPLAVEADALATALMVLGPGRGVAFARRAGLAVRLTERGTDGPIVHETEGFIARRVRGR